MGFKFANKSTTKVELPEGQWIEVRDEIGKESFNRLIEYFPEREVKEGDKLTMGEGVRFQEGLFSALVVKWSAPVPPTIESYRSLKADDEVTRALDKALAEHFQKMTPSADEGKAPSTSPEGKRKAG